MFWHEDDLLMQLCHRLLNSADNAFDVHVSVKLETREGAWGDSLMQSMKESLIKIQEFRLQKNYIDLVISRPHDEKSKFLVCAELNNWYYNENPKRLLGALHNDLQRLAILKDKVTENAVCLILNIEDEKNSPFVEAVGNELRHLQISRH